MNELSTLFPYLAGVALSLAFAYIPGLEAWYAALSSIGKRLVMLGLLALTAIGYVMIGCAPFGSQFGVPAEVCSQAGVVAVVQAFIQALIANQATFLISPKK